MIENQGEDDNVDEYGKFDNDRRSTDGDNDAVMMITAKMSSHKNFFSIWTNNSIL